MKHLRRTVFLKVVAIAAMAGAFPSESVGQGAGAGYSERELKRGQSYQLFDPKAEKNAYKLLVILPGGGGDVAFTPWCQTIYQQAIPDDFIAVQMIAPTWKTPNVVWPSDFSPTPEMKTPIDELFAEVVADVESQHRIDDGEIYTLSWSSGGPGAYLISATQKNVKGHFVAMSVFREAWLPKRISKVKGQRFFLYHSPDDSVCPLALAEQGKEKLTEEGAEVKLENYSGGHGWAEGNDHFGVIREAFAWLAGNGE